MISYSSRVEGTSTFFLWKNMYSSSIIPNQKIMNWIDRVQHIESQESVQWFIGFLVSRETEKLLTDFTQRVKDISEENKLWFSSRNQCYHATVEYFQWSEKKVPEHIRTIESQLEENRDSINEINSQNDFDESFHKIKLMVSDVNQRVYLCLVPHNNNPLVNKVGKKWQAHISVWSFPEWSLEKVEKFLGQFKQLRDEILSDNHFALDFSQIYNQVK